MIIIKSLKFIGGFIIGAVLAFAITYVFGYVMEIMNITLYDSESDQQRNFNIFMIFMVVVALIFGYLATKVGRKG